MIYFIQCLKKYATFQGRARRKEYWMFILVSFLLGVGTIVLDIIFFKGDKAVFSVLLRLGLLLPGWAAIVRRMHDLDKSGWFCLIPIYNLILACSEGTKGPNRFGPDPKDTSPTVSCETTLPSYNKHQSLKND